MTICVCCGSVLDKNAWIGPAPDYEILGEHALDVCDACATPRERFICPDCGISFIGHPILEAYNNGEPRCYDCFDMHEKLNKKGATK